MVPAQVTEGPPVSVNVRGKELPMYWIQTSEEKKPRPAWRTVDIYKVLKVRGNAFEIWQTPSKQLGSEDLFETRTYISPVGMIEMKSDRLFTYVFLSGIFKAISHVGDWKARLIVFYNSLSEVYDRYEPYPQGIPHKVGVDEVVESTREQVKEEIVQEVTAKTATVEETPTTGKGSRPRFPYAKKKRDALSPLHKLILACAGKEITSAQLVEFVLRNWNAQDASEEDIVASLHFLKSQKLL